MRRFNNKNHSEINLFIPRIVKAHIESIIERQGGGVISACEFIILKIIINILNKIYLL